MLGWPLRRLYHVDIEGLDNLPETGGVILCPNHRSFMDSIFLAVATPRPVTFVAKAEYFDRRMTRWVFTSTGQIPLRRGSPQGARQALGAASTVVSQGGTLGMYPEGTRSRDGKLHRGNLGPARLAAATGVPIVPVGLVGTDQVQSPGERMPHLFRSVRVRFGRPRTLGPAEPADLRDSTDQIMHDIAALSGQDYEETFAPLPVG
jgi:1-acyl-sn-glycerol-3-phosphate acyltransferase